MNNLFSYLLLYSNITLTKICIYHSWFLTVKFLLHVYVYFFVISSRFDHEIELFWVSIIFQLIRMNIIVIMLAHGQVNKTVLFVNSIQRSFFFIVVLFNCLMCINFRNVTCKYIIKIKLIVYKKCIISNWEKWVKRSVWLKYFCYDGNGFFNSI